jgi:hypothetical protein
MGKLNWTERVARTRGIFCRPVRGLSAYNDRAVSGQITVGTLRVFTNGYNYTGADGFRLVRRADGSTRVVRDGAR